MVVVVGIVVVVVVAAATLVDVVPPAGVVVVVVVLVVVVVVGVGGSVGVEVIGPTADWPATATGTCTGMPTARSATRPTAWEATPTARAVATNQAAIRPERFFIARRLWLVP